MFSHLHVHSYYSFHRGASSLERLVNRAHALGMTRLALTDTNALYGAVPFYRLCQDHGIRPILGVEIDDPHDPNASAVLLARNQQGYRDISRLITRRHLEASFSLIQAIAENGGNYFILIRSPLLLERLADLGIANLYAEVTAGKSGEERRQVGNLTRLCRKRDIPYAATNDVHFAFASGFRLHRVLRAIGLLKTVGTLQPTDLADADAWLKSEAEMRQVLGYLPEAFKTTEAIAEACDCRLELGRFTFPKFPLPEGETPQRRLRQLTECGLAQRYPGNNEEARRQMEYELSVIERLGFVDYFLVVQDLVDYVRSQRLPMIGRGSAANSLVSYCLGITHVDPLAHHLYFERFLNPERKTPPDIDLDFGTSRRDGVLDWIYARYGRDRVAMISTTNRYSTRSAIREVGKALGVAESQINQYTRSIPYSHVSRLAMLKEYYPECRNLETEAEPYCTILLAADRLIGYPRHLSIHCGGVVITPEPIWNWVPLERASKGFVITQMDMHPIEDLGLIKIDILGNRSLDVLPDTLDSLSQQGISVDIENHEMIFSDSATQKLLETGETMGCFYIESPAMRALLKKLHVHDFEGLTAASSIIRPGVAESGMMRQYIERHHGVAEVDYLHPKLKELLADTYGVMVYQEDVIRVAHYLGGMSLGEADLFRRAMSGKMRSKDAMQLTRDGFFASCRRQGLDEAAISELYRQIASFAGYSFCKAHSASFALLSFQVAYLKAHYPAEFMAAVISNGGGFYGSWAYLSEARRLGLRILPPDVNAGELEYTGQQDWLRVGLCAVQGLSTESLESLIEERRRHGSFSSLPELLSRSRLNADEARQLILCGAADCFGLTRPQLMWQLQFHLKQSRNSSPWLFQDMAETEVPVPDLPDSSPSEKLQAEREIFHFTLSRHPLEFFVDRAKKEGVVPAAELPRYVGRRVKVLGWKISEKRIITKGTRGWKSGARDQGSGIRGQEPEFREEHAKSRETRMQNAQNPRLKTHSLTPNPQSPAPQAAFMKFLSLEDLSGTFEVTLFPDCYRKYAHVTGGYGPFLVEGKVDAEFGVPSVTAARLENLRFSLGEDPSGVMCFAAGPDCGG